MAKPPVTRRQFAGTVGAVTVMGLAGCADDPDGMNGTGTMEPTDGEMTGTEPEETDGAETETDEEETETDGEEAMVRAVHASPDAPNVDVYVDEEPVLEDVAFRTVSDYFSVPAGDYPVTITAAGDEETVVYDETVTVEADTATSLVAIGELSAETFEVVAVEDDLSAPEEGSARVKAFHASPDAPEVDVVVQGPDDPLFTGLSFGEASDAVTVPEGEYVLEIRPSGEEEAVATVEVTLNAATVYTAFAMGYVDPGAAAADEPFEVMLTTDATGEAGQTGETETEEGETGETETDEEAGETETEEETAETETDEEAGETETEEETAETGTDEETAETEEPTAADD